MILSLISFCKLFKPLGCQYSFINIDYFKNLNPIWLLIFQNYFIWVVTGNGKYYLSFSYY